MRKIRYGVVGTGRGKTFMTPPECTGMELAAVCDRREDKLEIIKSKYDKDGNVIERNSRSYFVDKLQNA